MLIIISNFSNGKVLKFVIENGNSLEAGTKTKIAAYNTKFTL